MIAAAVLISLLFQQRAADIVFTGGNIYTVDEEHPHATAIACSGQRIVYVGDDANSFVGPKTKVIDLHGATVVPGLTDSHYHFSEVGAREEDFNLEGTTGLQDFLDRVAAKVRETKPGAWITGRGWIEKDWTPQAYPTCHDLDKVAPSNPVILTRSDGHGCVVNSLVLHMAHIDKDTKNPFGGQFMKDPATGEPTGMITDNAMGTVFALVPRPRAAEAAATTERELLLAQKRSFRLGLCEVHIPGNRWDEVGIIRTLYRSGKLKIRLYDAIIGDPDGPRLLKSGPSIGEFDGRFTIRGMKLYADGSLGSKSAWLLEPYKDFNGVGLPRLKKEQTMPLLIAALKSGVQVWTHCIGDQANRTMLDWYEEALKTVPASERKVAEPRWRIEHAQIVSAADVPRFAKLGVIPSMQPSHAIGDLHFAESRLGMNRLSE